MKLFIPGPVNVSKKILDKTSQELISHRSQEFRNLFSETTKNLQKILYTKNRVIISTSSGSGLMEGAIRNSVKEKVLVCVTGAFGKKWASIAKNCGKKVEILEVKPGQAITKQLLEEQLEKQEYEAVCITHNETSTGITNPIEELAPIIKNKKMLLLVDAVSSMAGTKIEVDKLKIDVCIASTQKCFALPPGLSVASISEETIEKAKTINDRGYYFDFIELTKNYDKNETPYTPAIGLIQGMNEKIKEIIEEGIENRFEKHKKLAKETREWAKKNGFELFSEEKYSSNTITCIKNNKLKMQEIKEQMKKKGYLIDTGYRKLNEELIKKGENETFRIPHMGDLTIEELKEMLNEFEKIIGEQK
jgi:aspartate aminotransferase-like enzyme